MNEAINQPTEFTFAAGELAAKSVEPLLHSGTGYWEYHFDRLANGQNFPWYLAVKPGKMLYSGSGMMTAAGLLRVLVRYISPKQVDKAHWKVLQSAIEVQQLSATSLIHKVQANNLLTPDDFRQAMRSKLLADFDAYLLFSSGKARFIPAPELAELPISGFDIISMFSEAQTRRQAWEKINKTIYSLKLIPLARPEKLAKLGDRARAELEAIAGNSIGEVAKSTGKDNLDVAQMFSKLHRSGLIEFQNSQSDSPVILVVDDSPIFLKQFNWWLNNLGYEFMACADATKALNIITQVKPAVVFLDINMPVVSGFELMENIRNDATLAHIPVVILTGDDKLSNKWRAQWGGSEFLSKPNSTIENSGFQRVLQELVPRLIHGKPTPTGVR
jgi:CheY-like chemotaxis protein